MTTPDEMRKIADTLDELSKEHQWVLHYGGCLSFAETRHYLRELARVLERREAKL